MVGIQENMIISFQVGFINYILFNVMFVGIGQVVNLIFMGLWMLGFMFIGMVFYKSGFFFVVWSMLCYFIFLVVVIVVGVYFNWMFIMMMIFGEFFFQVKVDGFVWFFFGSVVFVFGYVNLVMLLFKVGLFKFVIVWFVSVGCMVFINYLSQMLIMIFIFVGVLGFGLFGMVEWVDQFKLVLLVWVIQLIWLLLWLFCFKFGLLEWFWCLLIYGKLQLIVKC